MRAIHQFLAGFSNGDAISNEALLLRDLFRSWGYESEIFSEDKCILPELRKQAADIAAAIPACRPDDVVLLHLSIGSVVNQAFASVRCRKAILYHNITPAHYFELINKQTARHLAAGRDQAAALAGAAEVNMACSRFNAEELTRMGYRDVRVLPLLLDLSRLRTPPDKGILRGFADGRVNVLFVGRCAPNKKIEDTIEAFHCFQRFVEPDSRLIHVGSFVATERYHYLLQAQVRDLGLSRVHFVGSVPPSYLSAFYTCADLFLCLSEHEGFCIPVIESMAYDLPVVAYASAAVPETMDGAGVLFKEKHYPMIAETMGRLVKDRALRQAVIAGQRQRLARYSARDLAAELRQHLSPLLSA